MTISTRAATDANKAQEPKGSMPETNNNHDNGNDDGNDEDDDDDLSLLLDWLPNSKLVPLDDGHCPEGLLSSSSSSRCSQCVDYEAVAPPAVHVTDDAVSPSLCQAWYETMTAHNNNKNKTKGRDDDAWGTYVPLEEIYQYWSTNQDDDDDDDNDNNSIPKHVDDNQSSLSSLCQYRHGLAVAVAAAFVQQSWHIHAGTLPRCTTAYTLDAQPNKDTILVTTSHNSNNNDNDNNNDNNNNNNNNNQTQSPNYDMPLWWQQRRAAGVAVWALCAPAKAAVPYHVDYAEQVRYATNIMAMPLVGGILHCTPTTTSTTSTTTTSTMKGGDFYVHLQSPTDSMAQYQQHGYKSHRRRQPALNDKQCIVIPYRTNRLIHQAGYLPHGSTSIVDLGQAKGRVIVGLNVFGADVARAVQAYPEHAPRFQDWVRRQQRQRRRKQHWSDPTKTPTISLRALVQRYPDQARQWCRKQRKAQFQAALQQLERHIHQIVVSASASASVGCDDKGVSVLELQANLARKDGTYPSSDDVFVFVAHRCTGPKALYQIVVNHDNNNNGDKPNEEKLVSCHQCITLRNGASQEAE